MMSAAEQLMLLGRLLGQLRHHHQPSLARALVSAIGGAQHVCSTSSSSNNQHSGPSPNYSTTAAAAGPLAGGRRMASAALPSSSSTLLPPFNGSQFLLQPPPPPQQQPSRSSAPPINVQQLRFRHWNPVSLKTLPLVNPNTIVADVSAAGDLFAVYKIVHKKEKWTPESIAATYVRLGELLMASHHERSAASHAGNIANYVSAAASVQLHNLSAEQICRSVWGYSVVIKKGALRQKPDWLQRAVAILTDGGAAALSVPPREAALLASALATARFPADGALWARLAQLVTPGLKAPEAPLPLARLVADSMDHAVRSGAVGGGSDEQAAAAVDEAHKSATAVIEAWNRKLGIDATGD